MATKQAPRSMPVGARNVLRPNDSSSLWNCTLSPGWTREDADILSKALTRFGVGNWKHIVASNCLPGKTIAQLNLQTQRLLGQQSTAGKDFLKKNTLHVSRLKRNYVIEFQGLHIDTLAVGEWNSNKQGPEIKRKNGFIVNTGCKVLEELKKRKLENKKFEVSKDVWEAIELEDRGALSETHATTKSKQNNDILTKQQKLAKLQRDLSNIQKEIETLRARIANGELGESDDFDDFELESESDDVIVESTARKLNGKSSVKRSVKKRTVTKRKPSNNKKIEIENSSDIDEDTLLAIGRALAETDSDSDVFVEDQKEQLRSLRKRKSRSYKFDEDEYDEYIEEI
ncbi:hypothetical protein HK096_009103 [Nowakowskiella sp. JEL0078]|nr:hypothetical protein HK096_009103 [Nowakowskiella sp. JEL0078]